MAKRMDGSIARPRPFLALILRLLTAFMLASMAMLLKLGAEQGVHLFEMIFWRQAITLMLVSTLLAIRGQLASLKTGRFGAHAKRALSGLIGMGFVYGAVILLPLAEATVISFSAPFFAVMLGVILFKEKVGIYRWSAVALGFLGVVVIAQPQTLAIDPAGVAVGLVAAFLVAMISFQIQDLNTTEAPWSIVFWFTALSTPVAACSLPFVMQAHDTATWMILMAMAVCGAIAQILLTASLRFGTASVVLLIDYTALLWATLYGWRIFGQTPSPMVWAGAPMIIAAGVLIAWRERMLRAKKPD